MAEASSHGNGNPLLPLIHNPAGLEQFYRQDPDAFSQALPAMLSEHPDSLLLQAWRYRLTPPDEKMDAPFPAPGDRRALVRVIALALIAAFLANMPSWSHHELWDGSGQYAALFYLPWIAVYLLLSLPAASKRLWVSVLGIILLVWASIYFRPVNTDTNAGWLATAHSHLSLWALVGVAYAGAAYRRSQARVGFVKLTGETLVYTGILYLCGIILVIIINALQDMLHWYGIGDVAGKVAVGGLAASPVVAVHLAVMRHRATPDLAPLFAKIFSPLVLLVVLAFLAASAFSPENAYTSRDALMTFNMVLLAVLALVTFSISDRPPASGRRLFGDTVNLLLILTILAMDVVALSAILMRLSDYGASPNRVAVLGSNLLIVGNMALIAWSYIRFYFQAQPFEKVQMWIGRYQPVYALWAFFVTLLFPWLFQK
ncbi:MAG: hypothetical protein AB7P76_09210 [Candidatus Melainabacteria bacterium]